MIPVIPKKGISTMKAALLAAAALALPLSAAAQEHEMCFMSAITKMLPVPEGLIGADACAAACQDDADCVAWTYDPHSFEPDTMAGTCRLMPDVYQTTESDGTFCGRIER